jgi:hydroxypyruvate reductase
MREADLVQASRERLIAGAGLDVFVNEPNVPPVLFELDYVTLQAHRPNRHGRNALGGLPRLMPVLVRLPLAMRTARPAREAMAPTTIGASP